MQHSIDMVEYTLPNNFILRFIMQKAIVLYFEKHASQNVLN